MELCEPEDHYEYMIVLEYSTRGFNAEVLCSDMNAWVM